MEKKTYRITFMADLTEDDVRAMKKCFYDAMLESMQISPVWNLKLEETREDEEDEEEIEIDILYHDCSEEELRKMGCFGEEEE